MWLWIVLGIIVFLFLVYLFMIMPRIFKRADMSEFKKYLIAHRGMFTNPETPENSMKAFRLAVENGYGIELDVHLTTDGKIVVHHDGKLLRSCGIDKKITDCSYDELQTYSLFGTEEKIPLLTEVLELIDGKVPMVLELKGITLKNTILADETYKIMKDYKGLYCVESFNPMLLARWRKIDPERATGLLSNDFARCDDKDDRRDFWYMSFLLQNVICRPDFIAYNHLLDSNFAFKLCKFFFRPYTFAWTIRDEKNFARCTKEYDVCICEKLQILDKR